LSVVVQEHETLLVGPLRDLPPVVATGDTLFVHNRQKKKKLFFGID
jgi:hypothetical protein